MKVKDFEDPDSLEDPDQSPEQYEDDLEQGRDGGGGGSEKDDREDEDEDEGGGRRGKGEEVDGDLRFLDNKVNEVIRKRREEKEKANAVGEVAFSEHVDERLGEDFEDTPWVPPSVEVVKIYFFFFSFSFSLLCDKKIGMGISIKNNLSWWTRKIKESEINQSK